MRLVPKTPTKCSCGCGAEWWKSPVTRVLFVDHESIVREFLDRGHLLRWRKEAGHA